MQILQKPNDLDLNSAFADQHQFRVFDLAGLEVDAIEIKVKMRPMALHVIQSLIDSGDLDPSVRAAIPTFTLKSTEVSWTRADGFVCLPYITDDPVSCQKLVDVGAAAVMPLAAPIGSGLGIRNPFNLQIILEQIQQEKGIPVIVDAGVGTASDAARAMEMGVAGVLMNTAIAGAQNPLAMAQAMKLAVSAGRMAYLSGRIPQKLYATASSPLLGMIH